MDWAVEAIPDADHLYKRVHWVHITRNGIEPTAFKNLPKESEYMSVDWAKYSTAQETRAREGKPGLNAVVQLTTGEVRAVPGQGVQHLPTEGNRSHSGVTGKKTNRVQMALSRICTVVIPLEQNFQEAESLNL